MKYTVCSAFFICLTMFWAINAQVQTKQDYLAKNHEILSLDRENQFKLFDKDFYANQMFLLGELHGTADSYRVEQLIIDEIKKKNNFKYLVLEVNYIDAEQINRYLKTGDESILKAFFDRIKGLFFYSRDLYLIFTHVREINQKLPKKDRIQFIGIDRFTPSNTNLSYLTELISSAGYKSGSQKMLDEIFALKQTAYNADQREKFFDELSERVSSNKKEYQRIFEKRFWEFEFLLHNFTASFSIARARNVKPLSDAEVENVRESQMAENFATLYEQFALKSEKMFGFFGREHIYQAGGKRTEWMAARIKTAHPNLKIVSIGLRYKDSQFMIPTSYLEQQFGTKQEKLYFYGGFFNDDSPFIKAAGIDDLNAVEPEAGTVLFRLNAQGSPYRSLPDLVDEIAEGRATTDYFQYAILLRKSQPATPISEK